MQEKRVQSRCPDVQCCSGKSKRETLEGACWSWFWGKPTLSYFRYGKNKRPTRTWLDIKHKYASKPALPDLVHPPLQNSSRMSIARPVYIIAPLAKAASNNVSILCRYNRRKCDPAIHDRCQHPKEWNCSCAQAVCQDSTIARGSWRAAGKRKRKCAEIHLSRRTCRTPQPHPPKD